MTDRFLTLLSVDRSLGDGQTGPLLLERLAAEVCDWAGLQLGATVPHQGDWELPKRSRVRVNCEVVDSLTMRWRLQRIRQSGQESIASEIRLATTGSDVELHVSERVSSSAGSARAHLAGRPDIVPRILAAYSVAQFGDKVDVQPWQVDAFNVSRLTAALLDPNRQLPWVVVSRRNVGGNTLLDPMGVVDELAGLANVALIADKDTSFQMAAALGQIFSCFDGAVRLYWPGFVPHEGDDPYRHPLYLSWTIEADPAHVRSDLFNRLCRENLRSLPASGPVWIAVGRHQLGSSPRQEPGEGETPRASTETSRPGTYDELLSRWNRLNRGSPAAAQEPALAASETVAEPEATNVAAIETSRQGERPAAPDTDLPAEAAPATARDRIGADRDELLDLIVEQDQRISVLEELLRDVIARLDAAFAPELGDAPTTAPQLRSVVEAMEEAQKHLPRLHFLRSALRSSRKARYRHPARVYAAFEVMQSLAVERARDVSLTRSLEAAFAEYGLEYAAHLSQTSGAKFETEYTFAYNGQRVLMEAHLKLGSDFDPANCLRIHFEWDEAEKTWVIGHVGDHLRNTKT